MVPKPSSLLRNWTPPGLIRLIQSISSFVLPPRLEYTSDAWQPALNSKRETGWNSASVIGAEKKKWDQFVEDCQGNGPIGFSQEHTDLSVTNDLGFHNINLTYAYVLALSAHQ